MTSHSREPFDTFFQRLKNITDLPDDLVAALRGMVVTYRTFKADQDIVRQGDRPSQSCAVLQGWVGRTKVQPGGGRQITALHFPGHAPDLESLFVPVADHTLTALTSVKVAFIPHASLRELLNRFPVLAQAFWQETLIETAIAREWAVNLGVRSAQERIAHLLCEVGTRLEWIGQASRTGDALSFAWPLNQTQLGEVTGLSTVHVNRSLQVLRGCGLVEITRQHATIYDVPKLMAFAGFTSDYLLAERLRKQNRLN